jgi:Ca-activated chloride channel family protein
LDAVDTRSTPRGGTNIGDAVRCAADSFSDKAMEYKAIIVISDGGETDASYAVEASRKIFDEQGIRVFSVGLGDMTKGARIPITNDDQRAYMKYQGREVWTKVEPTLLQSMAAVSQATYFSNPDFRVVYDGVRSKVAAREFTSTHRETRYARFQWFASVAFLLLTIETLMTDRKAVST